MVFILISDVVSEGGLGNGCDVETEMAGGCAHECIVSVVPGDAGCSG